MSCDAYRDLWTPFFNLFWRYWSDCPWPVYLGTEHRPLSDERVTTLTAGDSEWTQRLRFCLNQISSDFVLLLLEDYFLDRSVSTPLLREKLALLARLEGSQLRLFPLPGPDHKLPEHPELGTLDPRAAYRVSTQAAFWKRSHLLDLLVDDNESIWNFEWNATYRSRSTTPTYYASYKPLIHYRQVVERGEWFRSAARYFGQQEIGCDFTARRIVSRRRAFKRAITGTLRNIKQRLSAAYRRFGT
jgi:hypothetical protein